MQVVYFDCGSGISGDMTVGALLDAGVPAEDVFQKIRTLKLPDCQLTAEPCQRKGFRGTKFLVRSAPEKGHRHLKHIREMLEGSGLSDRQRQLVDRVFWRLAEAEAQVHGSTPEKIHFHEVGAVDSIVDIVGSCVAWDLLGADRALASAVAVGGGTIEIAHGRCSVPAPATAELLKGVPLAAPPCQAELTTPTGAAILTTLVTEFRPLPAMTIDAIGYGAGDRDFPSHPNLLRVLVGSLATSDPANQVLVHDEVLCLETHIDDETGEVMAHCAQLLMESGALDVAATPVIMKKGRPGVCLTVLCPPECRERLEGILFRHTSTLGVRGWLARRATLPRAAVTVATRFGQVDGKLVTLPNGTQRFAPEFQSAAERAVEQGCSLREVMQEAEWSWSQRHRHPS